MTEYKKKRESICRICGDRLTYIGPDKDIHWEHGCVDDEGLICDSCRPMAKLQQLREEQKKRENE